MPIPDNGFVTSPGNEISTDGLMFTWATKTLIDINVAIAGPPGGPIYTACYGTLSAIYSRERIVTDTVGKSRSAYTSIRINGHRKEVALDGPRRRNEAIFTVRARSRRITVQVSTSCHAIHAYRRQRPRVLSSTTHHTRCGSIDVQISLPRQALAATSTAITAVPTRTAQTARCRGIRVLVSPARNTGRAHNRPSRRELTHTARITHSRGIQVQISLTR